MANKEHVKILKQGVKAWNKWRKENPNIIPDLKQADLSKANLSGVNLEWSNLYMADYQANSNSLCKTVWCFGFLFFYITFTCHFVFILYNREQVAVNLKS